MLAAGCPVHRREWIIEPWFDHVEAAADAAGETPVYLLAAAREDPTVDMLRALAHGRGRDIMFAWTGEDPAERPQKQRSWNAQRYLEMTALRNQLLGLVREIEPTAFLSVDSDILLHPAAITDLTESLGRFDAVGGGAYMMEWRKLPNVAWYDPGHWALDRKEIEHVGVMPADIIMAVKLMSPAAYAVDYVTHPDWGEDIGWSLACKGAGLKLGWDNRHYNKHVLKPWMLDGVDKRLGW